MKCLYDKVLEHLESKAPKAKGKLCGNPSCAFYVAFLISSIRKDTGKFPAHSCVGFVGITGQCGGKPIEDFVAKVEKAKYDAAVHLLQNYPAYFIDLKFK